MFVELEDYIFAVQSIQEGSKYEYSIFQYGVAYFYQFLFFSTIILILMFSFGNVLRLGRKMT